MLLPAGQAYRKSGDPPLSAESLQSSAARFSKFVGELPVARPTAIQSNTGLSQTNNRAKESDAQKTSATWPTEVRGLAHTWWPASPAHREPPRRALCRPESDA